MSPPRSGRRALARARGLRASVLACLALLAVGACGWEPEGGPAPSGGDGTPRRIASLACNGTDIVLALGQGERLVAVEEDCPCPGTEHLVKIRNEDHPGKMAPFSVESVLVLHPDAVIAHPDLRAALEGRGLRVVYTLDRQTYENIPDLVHKVGELLHMESEAQGLLDHMWERAAAMRERTKDLPRVSVYYETTGQGWTVGAGHVMDSMITLAGGRNIAGEVPRTRTTITQEAIFAADPDVIVLGPFTDPEAQVRARPGWDRLKAIREGRVYRIPPERRNVAHGTPRCVDECEAQLLPWLHPELFPPATGD